jgi:hypothetical protein
LQDLQLHNHSNNAGSAKEFPRLLPDDGAPIIDSLAVARMLRDQPNFSERFTTHLLARSIRIEEDLVDQLFNSSEKRLARALLLLAGARPVCPLPDTRAISVR